MSYNGWSNYETWCVSLWLTNDKGLYDMTLELGQEHYEDTPYELGEALKSFVEDLPEVTAVTEAASFVSDLLGAALSEVDWQEIATNLRADVAELVG